MRFMMPVLAAATLLAVSFLAGAATDPASAQATEIAATLSGDAEVPAVTTTASGTFSGTVSADETEISFTLSVSNLTGTTQAHIHCGGATENGPVAAFLFGQGMSPGDALPSPPPGGLADPPVDVDGVLSTGTLTESNLVGEGDCASSFDAFVQAVLNGEAYINVHTDTSPPGELRGQVAQVESEPATVPGTGGPPPVSDSFLPAWAFALLAGVVLIVAGGGSVALAHRQTRR